MEHVPTRRGFLGLLPVAMGATLLPTSPAVEPPVVTHHVHVTNLTDQTFVDRITGQVIAKMQREMRP